MIFNQIIWPTSIIKERSSSASVNSRTKLENELNVPAMQTGNFTATS